MERWIKRLLVLLIIGAGSGAAFRVLKSRQADASDSRVRPTPQWPPLEPAPAAEPAAEPVRDWLPPVDGECPPGYPIKANDNSHIYHVPGGRFYARPIAERCYATEEAAQRDGYRQAKN